MSLNVTLVGQMLTFFIFVFFTMKVVWPVLEQALEERRKKIAVGLEAAELGHKVLIDAEIEAKKAIAEAKKRSEEIVLEAVKFASSLVEEAKESAKIEKERIVMSGYRDVEKVVSKAKLELKDRVVELVVNGVEKILERTIDKELHKSFLASLVKNF